MTPPAIVLLIDWVDATLDDVAATVDAPADPEGSWFIDFWRAGTKVIVEWRAGRGYGISADKDDVGYGEGPDEVVTDHDSALKRVVALLEGKGDQKDG